MLFAARRLVARAPAALRVAPTPVNSASRLFTSSALRFAAGPPVIQGEGAKDGEMPTDEQQATGLERFELLGKLQGVDVFDMEPLQMTHLGTTENPIKVKSFVSIFARQLQSGLYTTIATLHGPRRQYTAEDCASFALEECESEAICKIASTFAPVFNQDTP